MADGPTTRSVSSDNDAPTGTTGGKGSAFWLTFFALAMCTLLSAIDLTAVGIALPTITKQLNGSDEFVWIGSAYALSSTAFLPLSGSFADIFGRRPVMIGSILFFALGSALAGAAQNMSMIIAARTIQGIGGGGILNLTEIILSDLVPLAERGLYQGLIGLTWAFAAGIGPPIVSLHEALVRVAVIDTIHRSPGRRVCPRCFLEVAFLSVRYSTYQVPSSIHKHANSLDLNLPLCGIAIVLVLIFFRVRTPPGNIKAKLARIDWTGNFIVVAGATLAITGLTFGGIRFPWNSAQVLAPLIIGLSLVATFLWYERKFPKEPSIPWEVVSDTVCLSGYIATFFHGVVAIALIYYISVYFQACLEAEPVRAGVDTIPAAIFVAVFSFIGGGIVQAIKKYRPSNLAGWVFTIVGFGTMTLMKVSSSTVQWVGYQVLATSGIGMLFTAPIFTVLAPLPPERNAAALAFFAFIRNFAYTFGITIAATVLQNELKQKLPEAFIQQFPSGVEIAFAAIPLIRTLEEPLKTDVKLAFAASMATVWKVMVGISGLGLLSMLLMKEVPMRMFMDERFGIQEGEKTEDKEMSAQEVVVPQI
ncbi:hypothetical protein EIP86_001365 [Pleurotus ostreatoroseus]|nr:hypothetical protein EIP86_001365 [Pleurotus ostreatoroseus]